MTMTPLTNDVEAATTRCGRSLQHLPHNDAPAARRLPRGHRAEIEADKDAIIEAAVAESHLPVGRITGEVGRTTGQLRMFAAVVRRGDHLGVRIDPAMPDREPLPRPDIRQRMIPLGPVAVFGASNFPLAFSTAGGDTASALAAGCPVVVKGHPAHPRTGQLVADAISKAVETSGLPAGHLPRSCSATASSSARRWSPTRGSRPSASPARAPAGSPSPRRPRSAPSRSRSTPRCPRSTPSSSSPAPSRKPTPTTFAQAYVGSLTLGSGQFCTNPGLLFLPTGPAGDAFVAATAAAVSGATGQTMLTPGIAGAYDAGTGKLEAHERRHAASAKEPPPASTPPPRSCQRGRPSSPDGVTDEVFGASGVIVRYDDIDALTTSLDGLEGQLTATIHARRQRQGGSPEAAPRPRAQGRPRALQRLADRRRGRPRHGPRRPVPRDHRQQAPPASAASRSSASSAPSPTRTSPPTSSPRPFATTTRGD